MKLKLLFVPSFRVKFSQYPSETSELHQREISAESMENSAQFSTKRSLPGRAELYPDTQDISTYFLGLAERELKISNHDGQPPYEKASGLTRRFAIAHSPDAELSPGQRDNEVDEKAIDQALEHLASSVLSSDPSVASSWVTNSRLSKSCRTGSMAVDTTMDALNALYTLAPSLLDCDQESHVSDDAVPRNCVEVIASVRPSCWVKQLCEYEIDGEEVYIKTRVNWAFVKWLWTKVVEHYGIWIDEVVLRILCAVPLRGGGKVTANAYCHEAD